MIFYNGVKFGCQDVTKGLPITPKLLMIDATKPQLHKTLLCSGKFENPICLSFHG